MNSATQTLGVKEKEKDKERKCERAYSFPFLAKETLFIGCLDTTNQLHSELWPVAIH